MVMALGIDGQQTVGVLPRDGCCPPDLCQITPCMLACNFVNALPKGPLWDRAKMEAIRANSLGGCDPAICPPAVCHSIVSHAVYTGNRLWSTLMETLAPALRESDPFTCFDTVDDWLSRYRWQDCFASHCRSAQLGKLTPLEVMGMCGCTEYCPPEFPAELVLAVKLGTVKALTRLQMIVGPNIDKMNFVLAPLGAHVVSVGLAPTVASVDECTAPPCTDNPGDGCCPPSDHPVVQVTHDGLTLPKPRRTNCSLDGLNAPYTDTIPAYYDTCAATDAAGLPPRIWPGVLVAECILRSVIRPYQNVEIQRGC